MARTPLPLAKTPKIELTISTLALVITLITLITFMQRTKSGVPVYHKSRNARGWLVQCVA